jgi:uncharacterized protein (TIGR03067 family)
MNMFSAMVAATALFAFVDEPAKKDDKDPLQGAWRVAATEFDGRSVSPDTLKERQIVFAGDKFKVVVSGDTKRTLTFTLDTSKTPKHIDIINSEKQETAMGIFALEKDELRLCYGEPGDKRPTEFDSPAGKRIFLLTLKREKP